jgi:hypothetical protein
MISPNSQAKHCQCLPLGCNQQNQSNSIKANQSFIIRKVLKEFRNNTKPNTIKD